MLRGMYGASGRVVVLGRAPTPAPDHIPDRTDG